MPKFLLDPITWATVWPHILAVALVTALVCLFFRRNNEWRRVCLPVAAFVSLGLTTGYLTGLSRAAAVGTVLPAVLSLLGAIAVILVSQSAAKARLVSLLILVFSVGLLLGTTWGSSARDQAEEAVTSQEAFEIRALAEDEVRRFREALKLPAWPYTQAPWPYAPAPSASSASAASKPSAD